MFARQLHLCVCRLFLTWVGIGLLGHSVPAPTAWGQLQTLSAGDADRQWREAQLQAFDQQLADAQLPDELKRELKAQRAWLAAWEPKPRGRAALPSEKAADDDDGEDKKQSEEEAKSDKDLEPLEEPVIDPDGLAKDLRSRLFDRKRTARATDTKALQTALSEHSGDVGLRQLQLHWIDQPTYRDSHWQEISNASDRVLALLSELPATEETKVAAAFANYRKARALAHALRGRPMRSGKIAGADKLSDAEREQMQNAIGEGWRQIETLVGAGHAEFFQLELYNLRRYGWSGQALELLERHAATISRQAYLAERRSILLALAWEKPAQQTAELMKERVPANEAKTPAFEIQFVPLKSQ